jgi:hypothetical protein
MTLPEATQEFLWRLFQLVFVAANPQRAAKEIVSFYGAGGELPSRLDRLLTAYLSSGDEADLLDVAVTCAESFAFGLDRQARLVAYLYERGRLTATNALASLSFTGRATDGLPSPIRNVADTVWLLEQDRQRGSPGPDDDDLLKEALLALSSEGLGPSTI